LDKNALTKIFNPEFYEFIALQHFINETLLDFLLENGLDPTKPLDKNKTGIDFAKEHFNYPLLKYYHRKGIAIDIAALPQINEPQKTISKETDFATQVKQFKKTYGIKSLKRQLLEKNTVLLAPHYVMFMHNYAETLTSDNIKFENGSPQVHKYINSFYQGVAALVRIPFRNDGCDIDKSGTVATSIHYMACQLKSQLPLSDNFMLIYPSDIYDWATQLGLLVKTNFNSQYLYVFSLTSNNQHILMTLSLIDFNKKEVLFNIYLNSWEDFSYIKDLNRRIQMNNPNHSSPCPEFYDASLSIQIYEDDQYCATYSAEIARALYLELLENANLRRLLETFAAEKTRANSWEFLKTTMQQAIKVRLPMFFDRQNETFSLKSEPEIKKWHIENRYKIGTEYMKELVAQSKQMVKTNTDCINHIINAEKKLKK
jgi:hypothetical protein